MWCPVVRPLRAKTKPLPSRTRADSCLRSTPVFKYCMKAQLRMPKRCIIRPWLCDQARDCGTASTSQSSPMADLEDTRPTQRGELVEREPTEVSSTDLLHTFKATPREIVQIAGLSNRMGRRRVRWPTARLPSPGAHAVCVRMNRSTSPVM